MTDRFGVLRRIRDEAPEDQALLAEAWLAREDTESVGEEPAEITVYEASCMWRLRAENLVRQGKMLLGGDAFLDSLGSLNPQKKLLQFSLKNERFCGSAFFEKTRGRYVGILLTPGQEDTAKRKLHRSVQYA